MSPQQSIAHYKVTSKLGEGGMGEVWRATDTKLGREVAIKVIPESFAADPDRMARFTREAQVLASLNHPNIAAIYGVEERALVMELVEGQTLAERIEAGAIPPVEAATIAKQIAEALEAAHERGVVHRDLKPANVKVTPDGVVKVLDFGLAKAMEDKSAASGPTSSPTLTIRATQLGMIMGTASYMSPEQASGKSVDKRADIWSFGVVLWEMLTGRRLFDGETISDTLADVLRRDLSFSQLPQETPAAIRELLKRCMERDVKSRLRDIGEARIALQKFLADPAGEAIPPVAVARRSIVPWAVAVALLTVGLAIAGVLWWRATRPVPRPLMRLSVDLGPDALIGAKITAAISPDGTRIVFPSKGPDGRQQLATRLLEQSKPALLPGTENGFDPFFSPDGQWIGFFSGGKLKKTAVQGGAPVALCDVNESRGAAWGEDGNIILAASSSAGLVRVPASGGNPQPITKLGTTDQTHRWPQILPGGDVVLFTVSDTTGSFENARIDVLSLKTGQRKNLVDGGTYGRYLPGGHLVYVHQSTLFQAQFDPVRLEVRGTPTPVLEDVASAPAFGAGQFDFSQTGTLVYLSGKQSGRKLVWLDASGQIQPMLSTPSDYISPRLSPDGKRLAIGGAPAAPSDLWVYEWQRDTLSRLTFNKRTNRYPVWTPDGKHIAFTSATGPAIWWIRSDGGGEPQRLIEGRGLLLPASFSPDGRRLAYADLSNETGYDLWTLPLDIRDPDHPIAGQPEAFLRTPSNERLPMMSPDGRWIAYASNESGLYEVYVRPFPGPGGKWQVSTGGGNFPVWSHGGRELFYQNPDSQIMVSVYTATGDSFDAGKPKVWSDRRSYAPSNLFPNSDISPDGKRFVITTSDEIIGENKSSVHVTFLLNFPDELQRKAADK